jgi:uncharacterized protein
MRLNRFHAKGFIMLSIEIVYAFPRRAWRYFVKCPSGTSIAQTLSSAPLLFSEHPELIDTHFSVGIHGEVVSTDTCLYESTRLEIYRPLEMDPKMRRHLRHKMKQSKK